MNVNKKLLLGLSILIVSTQAIAEELEKPKNVYQAIDGNIHIINKDINVNGQTGVFVSGGSDVIINSDINRQSSWSTSLAITNGSNNNVDIHGDINSATEGIYIRANSGSTGSNNLVTNNGTITNYYGNAINIDGDTNKVINEGKIELNNLYSTAIHSTNGAKFENNGTIELSNGAKLGSSSEITDKIYEENQGRIITKVQEGSFGLSHLGKLKQESIVVIDGKDYDHGSALIELTNQIDNDIKINHDKFTSHVSSQNTLDNNQSSHIASNTQLLETNDKKIINIGNYTIANRKLITNNTDSIISQETKLGIVKGIQNSHGNTLQEYNNYIATNASNTQANYEAISSNAQGLNSINNEFDSHVTSQVTLDNNQSSHIISNSDNITVNTLDIKNNRNDLTANRDRIIDNDHRIQGNTQGLNSINNEFDSHVVSQASLDSNQNSHIAVNAHDIQNNRNDLTTNRDMIIDNDHRIQGNIQNIITNHNLIVENTADIKQNMGDLANLDTGLTQQLQANGNNLDLVSVANIHENEINFNRSNISKTNQVIGNINDLKVTNALDSVSNTVVSAINANTDITIQNQANIDIHKSRIDIHEEKHIMTQDEVNLNRENISKNTSNIENNSSKIDNVQSESRKGIAGVSAISGIKYQAMKKGEGQIGVGYGNYKGSSAIAIGLGAQITDNLMINSSISGTSGSETEAVFSTGATYKFNIFN